VLLQEEQLRQQLQAAAIEQEQFRNNRESLQFSIDRNSELVLKTKRFTMSKVPPPPSTLSSNTNHEKKSIHDKNCCTPNTIVMDSDTSSNYSSSEKEIVCSICMGTLEEGDRIGALPCEHYFHVECLKEWLKRRNVCPLCMAPNIASSRRHRQPQEAH